MALVGITGSHGVGKSTLMRDVGGWMAAAGGRPPVMIDWIGGRVAASGLPLAEHCTMDTYCKFLAVHLQALRAAKSADTICDRTPFELMAYAMANGNASAAMVDLLCEVIETALPAYSILFYLPIEFPLEPARYRSPDPGYRAAVDGHLRRALERFGGPVVALSGDRAARLAVATASLAPVLAR